MATAEHCAVCNACPGFSTAAPPLQGARLLDEAAGNGEDDGFGPEAPSDDAVAALPLLVRRRVAALKHNQVALYLVPLAQHSFDSAVQCCILLSRWGVHKHAAC